MKFIVYFDNKSGSRISYGYESIEAKTLEEAIEQADKMWNEDRYLMQIMKKVGNIEKPYHAGYAYETYEAILCRRSFGWHRNVEANSETEHKAHKCWLTSNRNNVWYEIA